MFADHGVGGAEGLDKRIGLGAALAALRQKRAGVLLVAKRDRLARDPILAAMLERQVEREGSVVRAADGAGNGEGPEAVSSAGSSMRSPNTNGSRSKRAPRPPSP